MKLILEWEKTEAELTATGVDLITYIDSTSTPIRAALQAQGYVLGRPQTTTTRGRCPTCPLVFHTTWAVAYIAAVTSFLS